MTETVETLTKRLERLEKLVEQITVQLSGLVAELGVNQQDGKTKVQHQPYPVTEKKEGARIMNELLERMGIADVEPIPIEEVRKSMASRIRAEDNEFSRAIIEEREK